MRQCPHTDALSFELAYALHRAGKNDKVGNMLNGLNDTDNALGAKYLQAQVFYKLQKYDEARSLYEELLKEAQDDEEEMDILTNYLACLSQ